MPRYVYKPHCSRCGQKVRKDIYYWTGCPGLLFCEKCVKTDEVLQVGVSPKWESKR